MPSTEPPHKVRVPLSLQRWDALAFLHWSYPPAVVQAQLPASLTVDTFDGQAWVGLTPFVMHIKPFDRFPVVGRTATFPETNLRTYARGPDGEDGLWFFSLDVPRSAAVIALRTTLGLPYQWASMDVDRDHEQIVYRSRRRNDEDASHHIAVRLGEVVSRQDALVTFLTGRWRAYTAHGPRLLAVPVEHPPWPLRTAQVTDLSEGLTAAAGLPPPQSEPLTHYSSGVDVRIGRPAGVKDG